MTKTNQRRILNILCLFVILQPIFDILSNLYVNKIIPFGISTYVKPIFVIIMTVYLFFKYNNKKLYWILYACLFSIFMIGHFYILWNLYLPSSLLAHELRFIINIVYMILMYFVFNTMFSFYSNKSEFLVRIKKTILITFIIYSVLLIISVLTNTSGTTYEYADSLKKGFKGWFDSGQILGHSISIILPSFIYIALKPRNKWYIRIILTLPVFICICLLGTKVPFFILLAVLVIYILISIFNKLFVKFYKFNLFNFVYCFICIASLLVAYKYLPIYYNTELNIIARNTDIEEYELYDITGKANLEYIDDLISKNEGKDLRELKKYRIAVKDASDGLYTLYKKGELHPSDNRKVETYYSYKKYDSLSLRYKLFGIGFLNQETSLALESDFLMALFSYGILGFLCILFIYLKEFFKTTIYILRNITNCDLETYLMYAGLGIFFSISILAGYTYIYTNFSIYLILLIFMIKSKVYINESYKREQRKVKKISFLLLHLGFGGIESATINTANALSKKYDVEIVSLYTLKNNQVKNINRDVNIRYLYSGEPNKKEFLEALHSKKVFKIFKEGLKSIKILLIKRILIIKEVKFSKSDAIISTRSDFSTILSKYGKISRIKIAQEHRHHNNDKKYLNLIKNRYENIDYLLALTDSLKEDYEKLLRDSTNTRVFTVPNMIKKDDNLKSSLKNKNMISVGRLHPGKHIDELIDIFSKCDNLNSKLYIIGDGDEYRNILNQISKNNVQDKVVMLGYKNQDEIKKYLLDSSVFLMASETEGLPMVLIEAMSYGVPCIAYETESGTKDIISDGVNGFIIKNRNQNQYVKKLNLILTDKKLLKEMSKNAIETSKRYNEDVVVSTWMDILK